MTKDEALDLALEALEVAQDNLRPHGDNCFLHDEGEYNRCFCGKDSLSDYLQDAVEKLDTAIKQARSAPVQEPVLAGRWHHGNGTLCSGSLRIARADFDTNPPIEMQDRVFDDICEAMNARLMAQQEPVARIAELEETVRQLNHALREATESPTFMGEPVVAAPAARIKGFDEYGPLLEWNKHWMNFSVGTRLYTTPPAAQRPVAEPHKWVGLTDEERVDLWKATETDNRMVLIDAIEAKLKEKNT